MRFTPTCCNSRHTCTGNSRDHLGDVSPHRHSHASPGRMGMLFLVWGAQKVLKALPQGRKAMARCRWSWQRAPWLQLRLRCVPPPPPPPSVREAITAALSDPCWARWVHTLHRNIVPYQQVRWYHLVLCVTLVAMPALAPRYSSLACVGDSETGCSEEPCRNLRQISEGRESRARCSRSRPQ